MRLIVRSTSLYPAGSVQVDFSGSYPTLTDRLLKIQAILKAARKAGFLDFNTDGPEASYSPNYRVLTFNSVGRVNPAQFIQSVSKLVTANAGQHDDGDIQFVDQQKYPITGDLVSPTVDFLTLSVGLNSHDNWYITVKDWHNGLTPVLHLRNSHLDLHKAGFRPEYGSDLLVVVRSRVRDVWGTQRDQALKAEAQKIADLVLPHLRVRQPKLCQVEYFYGRQT